MNAIPNFADVPLALTPQRLQPLVLTSSLALGSHLKAFPSSRSTVPLTCKV